MHEYDDHAGDAGMWKWSGPDSDVIAAGARMDGWTDVQGEQGGGAGPDRSGVGRSVVICLGTKKAEEDEFQKTTHTRAPRMLDGRR